MDYVIIVAGGKGLRMGSDIPKQFLPIGGKPVLMRTLERFREYSPTLQIILVLPKAQQDYWEKLCQKHNFTVVYQMADGGETRFHSVQHGLALKRCAELHKKNRPFCVILPPSPFLVTNIVWYRRHNALTSNCSRQPTASPTTTDLQTTPLWSKLSATPSPSSKVIAKTSKLPPPTTSKLLKY